MEFGKGKYEPNVVKETIVGKEVRCNICGVDEYVVCLTIGHDFIFKILTATYHIDPEGYYWELTVVNVDPSTPVLDMTKMKESLIANLSVIDNFYEQVA